MPNLCRALLTVLTSAGGAMALASCERASDAPQKENVTLVPLPMPPADSQRRSMPSGWDPAAGSVLLVASERPEAAVVIFPEIQGEHAAAELQFDTSALRGATVALINRAGEVSSATLGDGIAPAEDEDCTGWPMLRVSLPSSTPASWSIGLLGARMRAVPLDSVGSLSPADSSMLVTEVARLASTIRAREQAARLRGLPFFVQDMRRFRTASGTDIVIAQVVRRVHEEASPIEERTLLIAERDSAQRQRARGRYELVFHQRGVGPEETLEGSEVLAALVRRDARPVLVLAHESESGVRYSLLERTGNRTWRVKWTSALVRC